MFKFLLKANVKALYMKKYFLSSTAGDRRKSQNQNGNQRKKGNQRIKSLKIWKVNLDSETNAHSYLHDILSSKQLQREKAPWQWYPANIYQFKFNNRNTRIRSGDFIVYFEHISHLVLFFPLLTLSK